MKLICSDLEIISKVKAVLESEYRQNTSQAQLANRFYINESKLRKGFKQVYKITIYQYVTWLRVEKAKELLTYTDKPIRGIAHMVGYHISNLEKQFFKLTGMTPLEWRKQSADEISAM